MWECYEIMLYASLTPPPPSSTHARTHTHQARASTFLTAYQRTEGLSFFSSFLIEPLSSCALCYVKKKNKKKKPHTHIHASQRSLFNVRKINPPPPKKKYAQMHSYQFEKSTPNSGAAASAWFSRPISPLLAQTSVRTASKKREFVNFKGWMNTETANPAASSLPRMSPGISLLLHHFAGFPPFTFSYPPLCSTANLRFRLHSEVASQK